LPEKLIGDIKLMKQKNTEVTPFHVQRRTMLETTCKCRGIT